MDLEEEILSRIRAAKAWDKNAKPSDFQIRAAENGSVLVNLKTSRAQLVYDDDSELHDLEDLCSTETGPAKIKSGSSAGKQISAPDIAIPVVAKDQKSDG